MKYRPSTGGRKGRRPRRRAIAEVKYRKDSPTNYYDATEPVPDDAPLPSRVYLTKPFTAKIRADLVLSRTAGAGSMLTGLRRRPGGGYAGNILHYDPARRRRVRYDLRAVIAGDMLTLTLLA